MMVMLWAVLHTGLGQCWSLLSVLDISVSHGQSIWDSLVKMLPVSQLTLLSLPSLHVPFFWLHPVRCYCLQHFLPTPFKHSYQ
ncbi:hypothetical protein BDP81DRAFT_412737 [Colletotrichum phormii]|uniref:Secreted protein n=1 Tax=Colletotrichum phormii TaxID=359342 RepID=A0AAJ0ENH2_9PEZI|nr:uncharacterized protein BDP81DRAFT_412737 [Colletotrichum phormii]KAK1655473.1 hypothetical protein BDP81DRAFT_412737 [Colletotrichum phormii]